jgi:hypothetical protein
MVGYAESSGIVRNVRLSPLNKKEIDSYTSAYGITDRKLQDAIERFCGGIPLALSRACETAIQHGTSSFLEGEQTINMITSICKNRPFVLTGDISAEKPARSNDVGTICSRENARGRLCRALPIHSS